MRRFLFTVLFLIASLSADVTKSEMLRYLDTLEQVFETNYGMDELKAANLKWSIHDEIAGAKNLVERKQLSVDEFQDLVRHVMYSCKDYHVGVMPMSTESATLPFTVKSVDGRYYVTSIDHEKLDTGVFSIVVGDEWVKIDGISVQQVGKELLKRERGAQKMRDQINVDSRLAMRVRAYGDFVPRGPVKLEFLSHKTKKPVSFQITWNYQTELVQNQKVMKAGNDQEKFWLMDEKLMNRTFFCNGLERHMEQPHPNARATRKSFVPKLGRLLWKTPQDHPFHAYVYSHESGKEVGYLRISDFMYEQRHMEELVKLMGDLNERTDALVIDLNGNPGGNLFVVYGLASMLTDQALDVCTYEHKISSDDYMQSIVWSEKLKNVQTNEHAKEFFSGDLLFGYPVNLYTAKFFLEESLNLINQWEAGQTFSAPSHMFIDQINPHGQVRYLKPVVVLTNALSASCADIFPAVMKDNGRAKLFGTTTCGAGGAVRGYTIPNCLGLGRIFLTHGCIYRPNGETIENRGVVPDVTYDLTVDDIQNDYRGYIDAVNKEITEALN